MWQCVEGTYCAPVSGKGVCTADAKYGEACGRINPPAGLITGDVSCESGLHCLPAGDGGGERCVGVDVGIGEACDPPTASCPQDAICNADKKCELPACTN
jgi:hypothetical protein